MFDGKHALLYVGKAKNLRARLRSYLNENDSRYNVKFLMRRVTRVEFLITTNEKEALLLENSLIKQHKPRYNVRLKDDKTYVSLRLNPAESFPRLTVVRRGKRDGARYFGPYDSAGAVRQTLRQFQRLFPLRTCSDNVMKNRSRPCLYYQMKQCLAPCVDLVNKESYLDIVQQVIMVLDGRIQDLEADFLARIQGHADRLEFEQAATLRDRLFDLRRTVERQRTVVRSGAENRDVFGLYNEGRFTEIQVIYYRGGKMLGGKGYSFQYSEMPLDELLGSFLLQYYTEATFVPSEILVPLPLEEASTLGELFSEQHGHRVTVLAPQRGEKRAMLNLAGQNALRSFKEKRLQEKAEKDALAQTMTALHLPRLPRRIECFDISTLQGVRTVASMVVFEEGAPAKHRYRRYSIKNVEGQDDFASMREVLLRRYKRAIEEDDLPDLVLIDGGKGQLNVAAAALRDLGIEDLPHRSIAKSRPMGSGAHTPERFFSPGRANPIILEQSGPVVRLLSRVRDEAHRFAITYHRSQRSKATLRTSLTDIPGIGPARARALLKACGSLARIRTAAVETLAAVPGFNENLARTVLMHLGGTSGEVASTGQDTGESNET